MSFYYCPKCKKKKLEEDYYRDQNTQECYQNWVCGEDSCGCKIQVPGRDAKIEDYYSPLDRFTRAIDIPQIVPHLLGTNSNIRREGLEVIYEGEVLDVVRRRGMEDYYGSYACIGAAIYWKAVNVEKDSSTVFNPFADGGHEAFRDCPAWLVRFRGESISSFIESDGYLLWEKDGNRLFKGNLGKRLKAKIAEWAAAFDKEIPGLFQLAKNENARWKAAKADLKNKLNGSGVEFSDYDVIGQTLDISVRSVSAEELIKLESVWPEKIKIRLLQDDQNSNQTPQEVAQVVKLLHLPDLTFRLCTYKKVSPETALAIAEILAPTSECLDIKPCDELIGSVH